jgi:CubicO group peptidase (beta-lactamase class C family)
MGLLNSALDLSRFLPKATNKIELPDDLDAVTQFDPSSECAPEDVGLDRQQVEAIWRSVEDFYKTGLQPGISLTLRRHGKVVLNRAIGHARGNGPGESADTEKVLMQTDTPVCLFSASKAITGMLIHKLAEDGRIRLRDRVADYVPEFGVRGKDKTTILNVLSHRAGIPSIPIKDPDPALLQDWDSIVQMLCAAKPLHTIGWVQAYHAITAGFVLGEVIRRVTGQELRDVMTEAFRKPLGFRYFNFGLDKKEDQDQAAFNYFTGSPLRFPLSYVARRVLGVDFEQVSTVANEENYMTAIVPAGNIFATADEASRFFQMMLNGGELDGVRIFEPRTILRATRPVGVIQVDRSLMIPMRFSAGLMKGEWPLGLYGQNCREAFGHLGFINIVCWADPARDISASLLTTGKSMALENLAAFYKVLLTISENCPPVPTVQRAEWSRGLA